MSQRTIPPFNPFCLTVFAVAMSASPWCAAETAIEFAIPAAPLADALLQFSETSGIKVFFSSQLAGNLRGNAVQGRFTAQQALDKLLSGTGLTPQTATDGTVTLEKSAKPIEPQSAAGTTTLPSVTVLGKTLSDPNDPYNSDYQIGRAHV